MDSYFKARAVLEASGGVDALRAAGAVRRRMSGDWFGSGQGRQAQPVSEPTATPSPSSNDEITSFIDYPGQRWLDDRLQSVGTSDAVTVVTAVGAGRGFEATTYQREKPWSSNISPGCFGPM